jgi:hypothetical protein
MLLGIGFINLSLSVADFLIAFKAASPRWPVGPPNRVSIS